MSYAEKLTMALWADTTALVWAVVIGFTLVGLMVLAGVAWTFCRHRRQMDELHDLVVRFGPQPPPVPVPGTLQIDLEDDEEDPEPPPARVEAIVPQAAWQPAEEEGAEEDFTW